MGCTQSRKKTGPPTAFKVLNLDCNGNVKNEGHMEITSRELVLHFKNKKPPTVWPLNSVRKYGYEDFMFCFEAGRSSPCGQGVFAFKCKNAKLIFDTIKRELSKTDNYMSMAEDLSLETHQYSGQASSSTNVIENHAQIQFSSLKYSGSNDYVNSSKLIEPENVLYSQVSALANGLIGNKSVNAGIFASDNYQLPTKVLTYTEVEIGVCPLKKNVLTPIVPLEQSDYKEIDFVRTMNTCQKMSQYSGQAALSTNENYAGIQFSSSKYSDSHEYVNSPQLIEPENILYSQVSALVNGLNENESVYDGRYASNYYQLPTEVLTYTEVEIGVCPLKKNDPLPIVPLEPSDYKVIDFVQTLNVSQKMRKGSGDSGGRKTRHDSTLEDA